MWRPALVATLLTAAAAGMVSVAAAQQAPAVQVYTSTTAASPDGIGKVYRGRKIVQVMGYSGADWLDRASREEEERTDKLAAELRRRLKPDAVVADIGRGQRLAEFQDRAAREEAQGCGVDTSRLFLSSSDRARSSWRPG